MATVRNFLTFEIHSCITAKAQTTIPRAVREALWVEPGDELAYEIDGDKVVVRRAWNPAVRSKFLSPSSPNGRTNSTRFTTIFEAGDLVRVPFLHVERALMVPRPALVVGRCEPGAIGPLLWTLMVTNARRPSWAGDIVIPRSEELGLIIPSKIRMAKISTVEEASASAIGKLDGETLGLRHGATERCFEP